MRSSLMVIVVSIFIPTTQCLTAALNNELSENEMTGPQVRAQLLASLYGLNLLVAEACSMALEDLAARTDPIGSVGKVYAHTTLSKADHKFEVMVNESEENFSNNPMSPDGGWRWLTEDPDKPTVLIPHLPQLPLLIVPWLDFFLWCIIVIPPIYGSVVLCGCCIAPGCGSKAKQARWLFLTMPEKSYCAMAVAYFVNITILVSLLEMALSSVVSMKIWIPGLFECMEWWFLFVFTAELLAELMWCPDIVAHILSPVTCFNVLATLPSYCSLFLHDLQSSVGIIQIVRMFRLCRFFKLLSKSKKMKQIIGGFKSTLPSLMLTSLMISVTAYLSSVLMYTVEKGDWDNEMSCFRRTLDGELEDGCSPFQNIIQSMYWSITTVTTVGYGDVCPKTALGKLIGAMSMVGGIITLALPIGMMSTDFRGAMEEQKAKEAMIQGVNQADQDSKIGGELLSNPNSNLGAEPSSSDTESSDSLLNRWKNIE